jgi:hypothetical protein
LSKLQNDSSPAAGRLPTRADNPKIYAYLSFLLLLPLFSPSRFPPNLLSALNNGIRHFLGNLFSLTARLMILWITQTLQPLLATELISKIRGATTRTWVPIISLIRATLRALRILLAVCELRPTIPCAIPPHPQLTLPVLPFRIVH